LKGRLEELLAMGTPVGVKVEEDRLFGLVGLVKGLFPRLCLLELGEAQGGKEQHKDESGNRFLHFFLLKG